MAGPYLCCPRCGHADLAPRKILIGIPSSHSKGNSPKDSKYREVVTLKCQHCNWIGEQPSSSV